MTDPATPRKSLDDRMFLYAFCVLETAAFVGAIMVSASDGSFSVFDMLFMWFLFTIVALVGATGIASLFQSSEQREVAATKKREEDAAAAAAPVHVVAWRGVAFLTKAEHVEAICTTCPRAWTMSGAAANNLARAQGLGNRMIRAGTKMEQTGATFTLGASGRRIAAGLEGERLDASLGAAYAPFLCPGCNTLHKVYLTKP